MIYLNMITLTNQKVWSFSFKIIILKDSLEVNGNFHTKENLFTNKIVSPFIKAKDEIIV